MSRSTRAKRLRKPTKTASAKPARIPIFVSDTDFLPVFGAILAGVGFLVLVIKLTPKLWHPDTSVLVKELSAIAVPRVIAATMPEPVEHMQFLLGILLTPPLMLGFLALFKWVSSKLTLPKWLKATLISLLVASTAAFIPLATHASWKVSGFLYTKAGMLSTDPWLYGALFFPLSCLLVFLGRKRPVNWLVKTLLYGGSAYGVVLLFFSIIFDCDNIVPWTHSLNPVIYPVAQVLAGKTLLVNGAALYGLYPHFIAPVFKVVGLTVFSFSLFNDVLLMICLAGFWVFLRGAVKNDLVLLCGFVALFFYAYLAERMVSEEIVNAETRPDPYFQYAPIRLLFPCLLLALASFYLRGPGRRWVYFGTFGCCAVAVLWNLDSGLVVLGSWLLLLGYTELFRNRVLGAIKPVLRHGLIGLASILAVYGAYCVFVLLRAHAWPKWGLTLKYYKLFSHYGYFMLPMPRLPHTWGLVVVVLVVGMALSLNGLLNRSNERFHSRLFLLTVMGVGTFSYYQGRSHDWNIEHVLYVPILIITLIADQILSEVRERNRAYYKYLPYALVLFYFCASSVPSLGAQSRYLLGWARQGLKSRRHGTAQMNGKNIEFMRQHTVPGEKIFIIIAGDVDGLYHAETGTASILDLPSSTDWFFQSEVAELQKFLEENRTVKVFAIPGQYLETAQPFARRYSVIAQAPHSGVALLVPKTP